MTRNFIQFYACFSQRVATQPRPFITARQTPKYTLRAALHHCRRPFHTSLTRHLSVSREDEPTQQPRRKRKPLTFLFLIALPAALTLPFLLSSPFQNQRTLNPTTFTPFTIVSREQVSPTAFVLTVAPPSPSGNAEVIRQAWQHGLWSVEIKQPQLQVAREYTPLPPLEGDGDREEGVMRLLIRRMDGGEVSGYLSRLREGDQVEVRGPRRGFDLRLRVGEKVQCHEDGDGHGHRGTGRRVVFLAGGTGIAPALQAARTLLREKDRVDMEVVWANRRREDCLGCGDGAGEKGVVVAMLEEMRARHEGRFEYTCVVDEEGSFIDHGVITRAAGVVASGGPGSSWWPWSGKNNSNNTPVSLPALAINSDVCRYHSAKKLVTSSDEDPSPGESGEGCQCIDVNGNRVAGGKSLLMVSGPDGFIARYVGAKVWGTGKELQGPVQGVVGDLKRKYPSLAEDWLVLKM